MRIERVTDVNDELVEALRRLVPQLSASAPAPDSGRLERIARQDLLLVARSDTGEIVGTLTLVLYETPTGLRARTEDVIVDATARGAGVGELLTREALRLAAQAGARTVELTSAPSREAANRLYERLGFERRETNVYRYSP